MTIQDQIENLKKQLAELEGTNKIAVTNTIIKEVGNGIDHLWVGRYVVIRSHMSGTHIGILQSFDHQTRIAYLQKSSRLWSWQAFTLSELAMFGCGVDSKIAIEVPEMMIFDVIELIPAASAAVEKTKSIPTYEI